MADTQENESGLQKVANVASPTIKALLPTAFSGAVESILARNSDKRQNRMYRENQRMLYDLSQESQRNAASNQVIGLRRAGLSTALAGDVPNGMGVAAASSPHGSAHTSAANPEMALIRSQADLIQSEAELNRERAEGQRLVNANTEGQNLTYASAYDEILDVMQADAEMVGDRVTLGIIDALKQNKNIVRNKGDVDALQQVARMVQTSPAVMATRIHDTLMSTIESAQANNPTIAAAMVVQPLLANQETRERIALMAANAAKFYSDAEANQALVPKLKEEINWLGSQIRHLDIQTQEIKNSDVQSALVNGDYDVVAANALVGIARAGKEVAVYSVPTARAGKVIDTAAKKIGGALDKSNSAPKVAPKAAPSHPLQARPNRPISNDAKQRATMKKFYGTANGETPQMSVMNGKAYYMDSNGNWRPARGKR